MPLWGDGWGCYWGDSEDHVIILAAHDFLTGAAVSFQPIAGYPQFFKYVLDGKDQGAPFYAVDGVPYTVRGNYSIPGNEHVYSIKGQGPWATPDFDATFASILFLSTRADKVHAEIQAVPELFSREATGLSQFSGWGVTSGYVQRFQNCRANPNRPTWGEMDLTMSSVGSVHTLTLALNGTIIAQGSRTGNGVVALASQNNLGPSFTVTLAYTSDIASGATLVAAFPAQYNVFYRSSGAWTSADFPAITAASWLSGVATLTIGTHSLTVGTTIYVSGVSPSGYNGKYVITAVTGTTVKYALTTNPGAYSSGGMLTTPTAIVYDDGHSGAYAFQSDVLAAGTWYVVVHQVNEDGEESSGTTNGTVTVILVPTAPTALALSNPTGDVISWLASTTVGATYNIYDSGSTGIIPNIATTTRAAGSGTLTKSLAAVAGFTGTRFVVVRSLSGGVESSNSDALAINYIAGVAQLLVPNTPYPGQGVTTVGKTITIPFSLDTRNQAVAATALQLFAKPVGTPIDYTSVLASLDLTVPANYQAAGLRIYGTITGTVAANGQYYYALRCNSANGQDQNVLTYGPVRLSTVAPADPVTSVRGGI